MRIRNILVPTDFSAHSKRALEYAIELARPLASKIHLVHAYYVAIPVLPHDQYALPANLIDAVRTAARAQLEVLEKQLTEAGIPYQSHLSSEHPVNAVLALAGSLPADLIVMGTRGLTGLKHAVLGSVAERTVRFAPCPVLTVKSEER